MEKYTLN